ncbi:hypothetical protein L4D06_09965 [Enterovibrio makurazakiensis]|uniref:hypothetical protein n=1 Tax=Enterovibrio makurazakiensis TaxID=2910232 RepID=UPI003D24823D
MRSMRLPKLQFHLLLPTVLLGLVACSDNNSTTASSPSSPSPTPTSSVSGTVTAPSGVVVNFSQPTLFQLFFPPAYAAIIGLEPVSNATVELIRIDDDGNQVGEVIASAPTSITGEYNITLPSGVSLAGNLVVRIRGANTNMNAIALDQKVNIDPGSHYIYQNLVDSDLVMADLAANHIVTLRGVIDELDLTAGTDLTETLAALDAVAGFRMKQEVAVLATTPGDAAIFEGSWRNGIFEMALHDHDDGTSSSFYTSMEIGVLDIESDSSDNLSITLASYEYNNGILGFYQSGEAIDSWLFTATEFTSTPEAPEVVDVEVTSDGTLIERLSLDEHLSYDNGDGPEFGFRTLPSTFILAPGGSDDVKVGINQEVGLRFLTVDTDNDGKFDAVDPNQKVGDEPSLTFDLFVKNGNGMSNSILDGNIGLVEFELLLDSNNAKTEVATESSILSFDGTDAFSTLEGSEKLAEIVRTPTSVAFSDTLSGDDVSGTYGVSDNGQLTLSIDEGDDNITINGFVSGSGDLLVASLVERTEVASPQPEDPPQVVEYIQWLSMGIGLGDTPPSVAGVKYKLYPMELGFTENGGTDVLTFSHPGTLTFSESGTQATLIGQTLGITRHAALGQVLPPEEEQETIQMTANVNPDSSVTLEEDDGSLEVTLDGFVSADGSRMLLSLKAIEDDRTPDAYHGLGFVFAVKED